MDTYVLVAGVNYEAVVKNKNNFRRQFRIFKFYALRRLKQIVMKQIVKETVKQKEDLNLLFFDFEGQIITEINGKASEIYKMLENIVKNLYNGNLMENKNNFIRVTPKNVSNDKPQPLSKSNYWKSNEGVWTEKFKNGQNGVLSVTDIYDKISEIGKDNPETLKELSIFSHSWVGGPIFVNSFDDRRSKSPPDEEPMRFSELSELYERNPSPFDLFGTKKRDPDDKDARIIDFEGDTIKDAESFKKAFHKDGFSWIWGCQATRIYKDLILTIMYQKDKNGKRIYKGKNTDVSATFSISSSHKKRYNGGEIDFIDLFKNYRIIDESYNETTITVTFGQIKKLFCKALKDTYPYKLAEFSGKKVYAAPLGAGSIFEGMRYVPNGGGLMRIANSCSFVVKFYQDLFELNTDPTKRNYIEYPPTLSCDQEDI